MTYFLWWEAALLSELRETLSCADMFQWYVHYEQEVLEIPGGTDEVDIETYKVLKLQFWVM
jgi:hypothetical protein